MKSLRRWACSLCVALSLSGIAAAAAPAAAPVAATPSQLAPIGPGDQLKVDVFGSPDLATQASVSDDGTIRLPLAGVVTVGGQTSDEAARTIEAAFKNGQFLINPQVTVTVTQSFSQRVSVLGEVAAPGRYPIESNTSVLDAIALAGGIKEKGADRVYILRPDEAGKLQRLAVDLRMIERSGTAMSATETLRSGDSILVPKATFFISGQVAAPGEYRIDGDMMLFEAIARAGGVTAMGSASRVEIRRRGPKDEILEIKAKKDAADRAG